MNYKLIKDILRIGIGSVFIIAAILKLISIDEFEIYIYSFGLLNFLATSIFSRLLIAGEFILGLFLILKIYYRFTWNAMMIVQILFTLFLTYTAIFRNDANCHCFGELIELSPVESIIKNIILIILLFKIKSLNSEPQSSKFKVQSSSLIVSCTLLIVFVVSPPDAIYKMLYSSEKKISTIDLYNMQLTKYNELNEDTTEFSFDDVISPHASVLSPQLIVIVSSSCKYCHLGVNKLSMMMKRMGINPDNVHLFIWGSDDSILNFIKETDTENYSYWKIDPKQAIDITYGRFPIFIWMENETIVKVGDFRDINEENLQLMANNEDKN